MAQIEAKQIQNICPEYIGPRLDTTTHTPTCESGGQALNISSVQGQHRVSCVGCNLHEEWCASIQNSKLRIAVF